MYINKSLKFPLTNDELQLIDKVWEFLSKFTFETAFTSEYRQHIIQTISTNYTIDQFNTYELIIEKLFWNLRWCMACLWGYDNDLEDLKDILPNSLILCDIFNYKNESQLNDLITDYKYNHLYYRSFINKMIIIDEEKHIVYFKKPEGSSDLFSKNYFNLYTSTILQDRKLYEDIMTNPDLAFNLNISLPEFYYEYDYGFPNLNYCQFNIGSQSQRLNRIKLMYYSQNNSEANWYRLLLPQSIKN